MIARVALVLGLAAAAEAATVNVACTGAISRFFMRIGSTTSNYRDLEFACDGSDALSAGQATVTVPDGQRFIVLNRADAGFTLTGTGASCTQQVTAGDQAAMMQTAEYCIAPSASGTYTLTANGVAAVQPENFFFDCGMVVTDSTVGIVLDSTVAPMTFTAAQRFMCNSQVTSAPPGFTAFATSSGIVVFQNAMTEREYFVQVIDGGAELIGINNNIFGTFTTPPASTCSISAPGTTGGCSFTDGVYADDMLPSFDFVARGGLIDNGNNGNVNGFCQFTCQSFGGTGVGGACKTNVAPQAAAPAYCNMGATAVIVQDCPAGQNTGGIVQCIPSGVQQVGQGEINAIFAAIAAGNQPRLAFNNFINALRAQGYGVAVASVCAACQAQVLANGNGGFVACANCVVLTGAVRRQVVANNGAGAVSVVVCPQVGIAEQTECLRAAACAGVFTAGATCSIGGSGAACPACLNAPRFDDDGSSSKKGLLGLLGLLALIPLCLLLLSSLLLCCLLLRRKKRAVLVPPPVMPTVAPMTSVCEPAVVCGGTAGYPGACSPYGGSAYPCV